MPVADFVCRPTFARPRRMAEKRYAIHSRKDGPSPARAPARHDTHCLADLKHVHAINGLSRHAERLRQLGELQRFQGLGTGVDTEYWLLQQMRTSGNCQSAARLRVSWRACRPHRHRRRTGKQRSGPSAASALPGPRPQPPIDCPRRRHEHRRSRRPAQRYGSGSPDPGTGRRPCLELPPLLPMDLDREPMQDRCSVRYRAANRLVPGQRKRRPQPPLPRPTAVGSRAWVGSSKLFSNARIIIMERSKAIELRRSSGAPFPESGTSPGTPGRLSFASLEAVIEVLPANVEMLTPALNRRRRCLDALVVVLNYGPRTSDKGCAQVAHRREQRLEGGSALPGQSLELIRSSLQGHAGLPEILSIPMLAR